MSDLMVHHFGPDPATVGGMASVIRVLTEHTVGGDVVDCYPTWRPDAPMVTARLAVNAACALMKMPASNVAHIHLSERGSFLREGLLLALARRRGLVTVATIHGAAFLAFADKHPRLVASVLQRAQLVICLERDALEMVRRCVPDAYTEIVPNPVPIEQAVSPASNTEQLVVFAGEISRRKGADVLHRAWRIVAQRCPESRCLMIGPAGDFEPPQAERLEVRAPVSPVEMKEVLQRARVVTLPSRADVTPMVLTEAMSLGRPFVSTPVGGIPELAESGGKLVPVDDEMTLAACLADLLEDPELARALGERGRRFCSETRSVEVVDDLLRRAYAAAARRNET